MKIRKFMDKKGFITLAPVVLHLILTQLIPYRSKLECLSPCVPNLQARLGIEACNIWLGCKGLTVTNTLAYYGTELITTVKIFIVRTQESQQLVGLKIS